MFNINLGNFGGIKLKRKNLIGAELTNADLKEYYFEGANLRDAHNLSLDQLSEVQTLQGAKLNEELLKSLKEDYYTLLVPENYVNEDLLP
jgi:uncharacterized protein YjbI with pentapeptide repeats